MGKRAIGKNGTNAVFLLVYPDQSVIDVKFARRALQKSSGENMMKICPVDLAIDNGNTIVRPAIPTIELADQQPSGLVVQEREAGCRAGEKRNAVHQSERAKHLLGPRAQRQPGTDFTQFRRLLIKLDVETPVDQGKSGDQAAETCADDQYPRSARRPAQGSTS
jgi:hypothetical protein